MIPSTTYSTPSLPSHDFPKRPFSANLSSPPPTSLAQRRRNNKNLSLCLLPSDDRYGVPPSTPFLSTTPSTSSSSTSSTSTISSQSNQPPRPRYRQYYQQGPVSILPGVYLGDEHNANNLEQLEALSIQCILNVAAEVHHPQADQFQPFDEPKTLVMGYKKRPWHHQILDDDDQIIKELDAAVMDIVRARKCGRNVLVHCQCGLARSATVVVAYAMYTLQLTMSAALVHVRQYAPHISPNLSLMYQLREYELWLGVAPVVKKRSPTLMMMMDNNKKKTTSSSSSLAAKWKSLKSKSTSTQPFWWRSLSGDTSS
ncbi:protein-tyrosine phosphatase-like protein [Chlamydoabsidia padenii]|nr:protein-tyrosine phosphatase-like protein [Chlamydoabsidia padenii]